MTTTIETTETEQIDWIDDGHTAYIIDFQADAGGEVILEPAGDGITIEVYQDYDNDAMIPLTRAEAIELYLALGQYLLTSGK